MYDNNHDIQRPLESGASKSKMREYVGLNKPFSGSNQNLLEKDTVVPGAAPEHLGKFSGERKKLCSTRSLSPIQPYSSLTVTDDTLNRT